MRSLATNFSHRRRFAWLALAGALGGAMAAGGSEPPVALNGWNTAEGKPAPSKRAYRLSAADRTWRSLPDLPEPRVDAASPAPVTAGERIFLLGSSAEVFTGEPREGPHFSGQTLLFSLARQMWEAGPVLPVAPVRDRDASGYPGPAPMIGAPCVTWRGWVVVVSGEVRISTCSPAVLGWPAGAQAPPP